MWQRLKASRHHSEKHHHPSSLATAATLLATHQRFNKNHFAGGKRQMSLWRCRRTCFIDEQTLLQVETHLRSSDRCNPTRAKPKLRQSRIGRIKDVDWGRVDVDWVGCRFKKSWCWLSWMLNEEELMVTELDVDLRRVDVDWVECWMRKSWCWLSWMSI